MSNDNIEEAEVIEDCGPTADSIPSSPAANPYPEGWKQATRALWNGVIFNAILILLCAILVFFFPKQGLTMNIGLGTLLVYFLIMTFTALGAINTYQKGLTQFAAMFGKDGARALDVIRWGFMLAIVGVVFHFFVFYLPLIDADTKRLTTTLLIGNSILILSAATNIVGFLMLATANGCPDPSRKGSLLMIVAALVLLGGAFVAPYAITGSNWTRIVEFIILATGAILFMTSWRRIIAIRNLASKQ